MDNCFFITGIGTDVGKTVASAIVTEALQADYWKPIQAGDLNNSDSHKVERLVSNSKSKFHSNAYALNHPESPHSAAEKDGVLIESKKVIRPVTKNRLVVEGAGGILVPINNTETILNLIKPTDKVIVVSRHYLGSINHTLLTINYLVQNGVEVCGLIFNGNEHHSTESIITKMTGVKVIGRIDEEEEINQAVVSKYAEAFKENLLKL